MTSHSRLHACGALLIASTGKHVAQITLVCCFGGCVSRAPNFRLAVRLVLCRYPLIVALPSVLQCTESSQSSKQHTLLVKCTFDSWLLATNSKENMLQWAASLHSAKPSQQVNKQAVDLVLAQHWLDLPKEDEYGAEVWERHWFILKNSVLNMYSEEQKITNNLSQPLVALAVTDMVSATRGKGVEFYKWGIVLETTEGAAIRMRAVGQSEMRQLLSTLNVHCIVTKTEKDEALAPKTKAMVRAGWLFKKSEKKAGVHVGKAWQRRWFILEVWVTCPLVSHALMSPQVVHTGG